MQDVYFQPFVFNGGDMPRQIFCGVSLTALQSSQCGRRSASLFLSFLSIKLEFLGVFPLVRSIFLVMLTTHPLFVSNRRLLLFLLSSTLLMSQNNFARESATILFCCFVLQIKSAGLVNPENLHPIT